MPTKGPHPPEVKDAAYVLYTRNPTPLSLQQIADFLTERYGRRVHKVTVLEWLRETGVEMRSRGVPPEKAGEACRLYRAWGSTRKVALLLGVGREWVRRALHANGVAVRPRGRPPKKDPPQDPSRVP